MTEKLETAAARSWMRPTLELALIFVIGAMLVFLSHSFSREAGRIASIWPVNAFLLAALLRTKPLDWRFVLGAGALANVLVDVAMGDTFTRAVLLTAANGVEIAICLALLRRGPRAFDITNGGHLARFVVVAGVAAPVASALVASLVLLKSAAFLDTFGIWYAADALGLLIFTPALLALASQAQNSRRSRRRTFEVVASLAFLAVVSALVFGQDRYPILFLLPPALTLATFRLGIGGAASGVLLIAASAIGYGISGHGPIQLIEGSETERILVLQGFLALMSLTTLPIAAALAQAERARRDLDAARRAAEAAGAAALQSEARYRMLTDYSTDLVVRLGKGGIISYASPACRGLFGIDPADAVGRSTLDFVEPSDRARASSILDALFAGPEPDRSVRREFQVRRADGSLLWLEGNPSIIRNSTGEPIEVVTTYRDVTARRQLEEALNAARKTAEDLAASAAESEHRYRTMSDISLDMIARMDLDGTIRFVSPSSSVIMGYTPEELVGAKTLDFTHPDDIAGVKALFRELLADGPDAKPRPYAFRARRKDGRTIWLEGIPRILYDAQGTPVEIQDSARDITARKQLERDLAEARREAEKAAAAKADFLANMSHEIRTPLNSIIGFSRVLQDSSALGAQERRYAELVSSSGRALLAIIDDVLDLSALDAGAIKLEARPFSPSVLLQQTIEAQRLSAEAKGLSLRSAFEGSDGDLLGDEMRLRQVLTNLIGNAIKFTEAGSVTVSASIAACAQKRALRVEVRDTGIGIAESQREVLFQRFAQADASVSRRFGGSGLGLAISKDLMTLMDGRIGLDSTSGAGSMFWFEIELETAGNAKVGATAHSLVAPAPRPRILVVDDVDINRELLGVLLNGHAVEYASDGAEAIAKIRSGAYDLVLMDVQMPGIDGITATRRLREDTAFGDLPIIAVTAHALPEQVASFHAAGMNDYLPKPVDAGALAALIDKWTGGRGAVMSAPESTLEGLRVRFVARCAQDLIDLGAFDPVGDADAIRAIVHRLAGAASNFGFAHASAAALALDQAYDRGVVVSLQELAPVLAALEVISIEASAA